MNSATPDQQQPHHSWRGPGETNLNAKLAVKRYHCGDSLKFAGRIVPAATLIFFAVASQAHADPLLLETGQVLHSVWLILAAGLALEAVILAHFIKRPFREALTVCLLANAITGFMGFVGLLFLRFNGVPILPPGPTALAAALIEAPLISVMLIRPPVKRIFAGAFVANMVTGLIAFTVMAPQPIRPSAPTAAEDLAMARAVLSVRDAIGTYHERYGIYPTHLLGGAVGETGNHNHPNDPLLRPGSLDSYPANPYASFLRTRRFNLSFLLFGTGQATRPVSLDRPMTAWEARWFPTIRKDNRFGDPDHMMVLANGLSEAAARETLETTFYHMNGNDYIPGCFFYKAYDFNRDSLPDDYILGAYGWPSGMGSIAIDLIDAATGELRLTLDSSGRMFAGQPDGRPEAVLALCVAGTPIPN